MILSVQIIDGDVLWAKMPDYVVLRVKVRAEMVNESSSEFLRSIEGNNTKKCTGLCT